MIAEVGKNGAPIAKNTPQVPRTELVSWKVWWFRYDNYIYPELKETVNFDYKWLLIIFVIRRTFTKGTRTSVIDELELAERSYFEGGIQSYVKKPEYW